MKQTLMFSDIFSYIYSVIPSCFMRNSILIFWKQTILCKLVLESSFFLKLIMYCRFLILRVYLILQFKWQDIKITSTVPKVFKISRGLELFKK